MAEMLIDGTGKGYRAGVTPNNELRTVGAFVSMEHHVAHKHHQGFVVPLTITPTGAGSVFLHLTNTDNANDLNITKITIQAATADYVDILHTPTGTPTGTTTISPVNMVIGSGTVANCTAYSGVALGGLTGGTLIKRYHAPANGLSNEFTLETNIIVTNGRTVIFKAGAGAIALTLNITFNFHNSEDE